MGEAVDHPPHYGGADNPYEAIKVIEAWSLGFCLGNTVKYISMPLKPGQWHLPFVEVGDEATISLSVARCASTSYKTVDGFDMTPERAVALHDKLVAAQPMHASPCEHQATPDTWLWGGWQESQEHGNFVGWRQYRKTLAGEAA